MLKDSHISITSANDVYAICQPLFKKSKVVYFDFKRSFPDGNFIWLATNGKFVKRLSSLELTPADLEIFKNTIISGKRYHLWNTKDINVNDRMVIPTREFNLDHGLTITEFYSSHHDQFSFATDSKNAEIYDFYLNNLDFIEKFIYYFKDKAALLIKQAASQKIYHPGIETLQSNLLLNVINSKEFNQDLKINKYIFTLTDKIISLTARELSAVKLIGKGCTIKEAAQHLGISPRTVEYYLKCARSKLNVQSNKLLILTYWQSTLARLD